MLEQLEAASENEVEIVTLNSFPVNLDPNDGLCG